MEAIQNRVSGFMGGFLRDIGEANGIEREEFVLGNDHGDRSRNVLCVDKLLDRRANSLVSRFGRESERRQEQQKSADNTSV